MKGRGEPFFVIVVVFLTAWVLFQPVGAAVAGGISRISIQELKSRLDSPGLLIIDVRDEIGWSKSAYKIVGAIHEDQFDVKSWAGKYPKDKPLILYCA